jgi:chromosome partitioning protein
MDPATWADRIITWATAWGRAVVIDTHPGENSLTAGALAAANVIVTPVLLGERELDALEGMLRDRASFPIVVAPNRFRPRAADLRLIEGLGKLTATYGVAVTPVVSDHSWLPRRRRRTAITLEATPGQQLARAASEFRTVAQFVKDAARG